MRWLVIAILLILSPVAARLDSWDMEVGIDQDKSTEWVSRLVYSEPVERSDFFVLARITGVEVKADGNFIECTTSVKDIGTSVLCQNINAREVTYRFRALGLVTDFQGLNRFEYRFSVNQLVDNFTVTVKLPVGAGLVERSRLEDTGFLPFEPAWGKPNSDGRNIFITWSQSVPLLGSGLDVRVIYENVVENQLLPLGIIALITAVFFSILVFMRRTPMRDILPVLTVNERKVMEILLREKKPVDQRAIVKETDFSKPKVSRIIGDLEVRGLVIRSRKGRTNVITLAQNVKKPENTEKTQKSNTPKLPEL